MTRSKTLAAAEKKALEGKNESQDSQYVLDQYRVVYGIGVLPQQDFIREGLSVASLPAAGATDSGGQDRGPDPQTTSFASAAPGPPDATNFVKPPLAPIRDDDAIDPQTEPTPATCALDETSRQPKKVNVSPRSSRSVSRKKVKMDVSQQSPTQDNDERDYQNYYDGPSFVETSPISQDAVTQSCPPHDEDSGPVNFGNLSHLIQEETQPEEEPSSIPDDVNLATGRGAWRRSSSQQHSSVQRTDIDSPLPNTAQPPQTPANNPFAGIKKLGDPALVGSQLFGQTQFSSAVKRFSPTSSRPSPHVYAHNSISPNVVETSPLKNRYNIASSMPPSSPQITRTESPGRQERSPSVGQPDDGTVPESPQYAPANTRVRPEPPAEYESAKEPQRRRLSNEVEDVMSGDDTDDFGDDFDDALRRRRLVAQKQEAASKQLANISVGRRSERRSVEVPSTTKRTRTTRAGRYRGRRVATTSDDEADEFTVADSQGQEAQRPRSRASPDLGNVKPAIVSSNEKVPDSTGATQKSNTAGAVPETESSGNSSRPKDVIPETSPTNTQSHPEPVVIASSDQPLAKRHAEPVEEREVPAETASQDRAPREAEYEVERNTEEVVAEVEPAKEPDTELSEPAPVQPSRRSGRKPRPTPKAQSLKTTARAAASVESANTEGREGHNSGEGAAQHAIVPAEEPIMAPDAVTKEEAPAPADALPVEDQPALPSSPPIPKTRSKNKTSPAIISQNKPTENTPATPDTHQSPTAAEPPGSTSTLSDLTATPAPSDKTSPATQESVELPPLSPEKPTRGRQSAKSLSRVTTGSRVAKPSTRRQSRRSTRLDSASTDELTRSPSLTGFENSIIQPPKQSARGSRLSMLSYTSKDGGGAKIFAGMAFAISFQSKKDGEKPDQYEHRLGQSRDVEKMISQAGGHLLTNGFDELFEANALKSRSTSPASDGTEVTPLTLTPWAQSLGFTALIADGHSRKVKYMQALALGLPCISDRWVATCVAKGTVVDWLPYLLCAGQSTFLRDAIRSRSLAPYAAIEARLGDVVERRPKMLEGSKILLVMKKSRAEDKKMPYVFLAHVLGATLSRAYNLEEAKETLKQREELDDPFDWVYVDEHTGTEEGLFSSAAPNTKPSKKRKRPAAPVKDEADRAPKRIRTLSDELVIQSLILGRMIEEGELDA
ncbi:DNA repair protein crb2 [Colletotrichum siamense]|uniref:DNA repair protein crb2 n=1 Tax=Colletotrichum siamense TaxID=690259 RepID=A0A9P5EK18_COLSI|nr:DNA repair protein crb2 [Colletotrichum siamense]KAF4848889.1 DNA repair protein crb2 [Colletotrichum siamense]